MITQANYTSYLPGGILSSQISKVRLYLSHRGKIFSPIGNFANGSFANWRVSWRSSPIGEYRGEVRQLANCHVTLIDFIGEICHDIRQLASLLVVLMNYIGEIHVEFRQLQ